jgi:outer membrane biosynthesis protein TonB
MIPRTLVPVDVHPVKRDELKKPAHRLTTYMDDRTVVPSGLSEAPPLDGKTSIPQHLPLGVLVERTLVPRGMPANPMERPQQVPAPLSFEILDSRVVVPADVEPLSADDIERFERAPEMTEELREIIEPDIFTTGDANLLIEPEENRDPRSDLITRVLSVLVHIGLIIFLIFTPKIFPPHVPTQQEIDLAQRQLTYILPHEPPSPPRPPSPRVRIDPKTLNRIAPPLEPSPPAPTPAPPANAMRAPADLPEAPKPQPSNPAPAQPTPAPSQLEPIRPSPQQSPNRLNLQLPQTSPGKAIQDQLQDAIKHSGGGVQVPGGDIPRGGGGRGMQPGAQILTPTEGVDFTSYIQRLLATIKRNWYAVMPESAMMGEKGVVSTTFQINRDGSVPSPDPLLERTSGREPLDNAAMSSIHASNPFEPLPSEFHGPYIRLRITFLYNLPLDYGN